MTELLSRPRALSRIISVGIESVLADANFDRANKLTWVRNGPELNHVVALLVRRESYDLQWGIVSPEAVWFFWGRRPTSSDVGEAIVTGTPGTIRHPPSCQSFQLMAETSATHVEEIASCLKRDVEVVEAHLRRFQTRRELRSHLMQNRDAKDHRDFVIPMHLPLKLFTAAVLAVLDHDPEAINLAHDAETALSRHHGELTKERLRRLEAAILKVGIDK